LAKVCIHTARSGLEVLVCGRRFFGATNKFVDENKRKDIHVYEDDIWLNRGNFTSNTFTWVHVVHTNPALFHASDEGPVSRCQCTTGHTDEIMVCATHV
jgi:hypothetical protein